VYQLPKIAMIASTPMMAAAIIPLFIKILRFIVLWAQMDRITLRRRIIHGRLRIRCKTRSLVDRSRQLVQIRPTASVGFYENAACVATGMSA
jgi:hypothetical protein